MRVGWVSDEWFWAVADEPDVAWMKVAVHEHVGELELLDLCNGVDEPVDDPGGAGAVDRQPLAEHRIVEHVGQLTGDLDQRPARTSGGEHVLLRIREDAVRQQIGQAIETDPTLTRLTAEAISDGDIRTACLGVVERSDLSEERGAAEFRAALAAIRHAEQRRAAAG